MRTTLVDNEEMREQKMKKVVFKIRNFTKEEKIERLKSKEMMMMMMK